MDKEEYGERVRHEDDYLHALQSMEAALETFADSISLLLSSAEDMYPRAVWRRYKTELDEALVMANSLARRKREVYGRVDRGFDDRHDSEEGASWPRHLRKGRGLGAVRRKRAARRKRAGHGMGRRVSTTSGARRRRQR